MSLFPQGKKLGTGTYFTTDIVETWELVEKGARFDVRCCGRCFSCGRRTFIYVTRTGPTKGELSFEPRTSKFDPRGLHVASKFVAADNGFVGDDLLICYKCHKNNADAYKLALVRAEQRGWWKKAEDDNG